MWEPAVKKTKLWLGVGVAVVAGTAPAAYGGKADLLGSTRGDSALQVSEFGAFELAQHIRGEGGENESGEGGIDAAAADRDPVRYGIALQVIAAHYRAGVAAYEAGETTEGMALFAHGHSEVYAEMEDVFKRRGVRGLGEKLESAIAAANRKAPIAEVKKIVEEVYAALSAAEKVGPVSSLSPLAVKARVVADMLDRAASQYGLAIKKDATLETYLDGLGFALAAKSEAASILPQLEKVSPGAAKTLRTALDLAATAYPGMSRGNTMDGAKFLAAASAARIAAGNLR